MKTCDQYQESVSAYVDGELNDDETREIFFHLGTCAECRNFLSSVLDLQWVLLNQDNTADGRAHGRPEKASLIVPKGQNEFMPVWKRKFSISYAAAAAVIVLMLVSAALFMNLSRPPAMSGGRTQTEYVYLTSYPIVDVVASPLPPKKSY